MKLENKVAIVTGAAGGIGYATAQKFLEEGASVFICDVDEVRIQEASGRLGSFGPVAWGVVDITDQESAAAAVAGTVQAFGPVDILVNNAGITDDAQLYKMSIEQYWRVMEINLKGTVVMSKAVLPIMMEKHYGKILHSASISALAGNFGQSNYAASKAAVMGLTRSMGKELGKWGINVNAVAPGFIRTRMTDQIPSDIMRQKIDRIPLKRVGEPRDIANVYAFLASEEASFVNAAVIIADGGML
jgi:3-oxoacyl-[acyl-carrier protein] reductase